MTNAPGSLSTAYGGEDLPAERLDNIYRVVLAEFVATEARNTLLAVDYHCPLCHVDGLWRAMRDADSAVAASCQVNRGFSDDMVLQEPAHRVPIRKIPGHCNGFRG